MDQPRIEQLEEKRLVGMKTIMTLAENTTASLWQSFMPRLREVNRNTALGLYSVQLYPEGFSFESTDVPFEKWAAVPSEHDIPDGMDAMPAGTYAVFIHRGAVSEFPKTMHFIFDEWMPSSPYRLSARPQFEIMGPDYRGPSDPDSKEEVWIPIELK